MSANINYGNKKTGTDLFQYNRIIKKNTTSKNSYFQWEENHCNEVGENEYFIVNLKNKILNKLNKYFDNFYNNISFAENEFFKSSQSFYTPAEITTPSEICGYFVWFISDFLTSERLEVSILSLILILNFAKISNIVKKFLTHENSKKIYFYMYIVAISIILAECVLLLTSPVRNISDQGIMFLYIYVTAILMLFLIFLTLTTCESYLSKENVKDSLFLKSEKLDNYSISLWFLLLPLAYLYSSFVTEIVLSYASKLSILESSESITMFADSLNGFGIAKLNRFDAAFESAYSPKNIWSVFDSLKFDILDTYTSYILSAVLQSVALIIVILSLIM